MKRKVKDPTTAVKDQSPEEKRREELWERWDRFLWRMVGRFLRELCIAVIIGIVLTILVYVFCTFVEKYL